MIQRHAQRSNFRHLLTNMPKADQTRLGLEDLSITTHSKWRPFSPTSNILPDIINTLSIFSLLEPDGTLPALENTDYWKHASKIYSPTSVHRGNSCVQLHQNEFGIIQKIFRIVQTGQVFFIVNCFSPLQGTDILCNPYRLLPHLKADVFYRESSVTKCITVDHLFGHCVVFENVPETFGILKATNIVVSLRSMVRLISTMTVFAIYVDVFIDSLRP